jgi:hypothetical protein
MMGADARTTRERLLGIAITVIVVIVIAAVGGASLVGR